MNRKQDGMTLIEVIAAITLLSIVILAFAYVFIQSQQVTTNNGERLTALQLAQKELSEALDDQHLLDKPPTTQIPSNPDPNDLADTETIDHVIYETYVYRLNDDSEGNIPIVVRTYYSNTKYVELYNYYTTK